MGGNADRASARNIAPLAGLRAQLATMVQGMLLSPERWMLALLALGVVVVLVLTAAAQVALNAWNAPFYNAIQARDLGAFLHQLGIFLAIAGTLLVLNVVQMWLNLTIQLKLRAGLMHDLLDLWLAPLRAFRLAHCGALGVNPDQRLHEDTRHLTELTSTLAIALLQATILLCVFVVVLWRLSAGFAFTLWAHTIVVPGYMVWAAIAYALIGSLASYRVGRSLFDLNAARYAREAELRYSLVRVSDHIATIALHRGEASERRSLESDLGHVLSAMRAIVVATMRLTWVTAGYGWLTQVVPILVAAPVYFSGRISFGELMMAVGAFNQVQSSLRWFVDNFSSIADWRATLQRVADFRNALIAVDGLHQATGEIEVARGAPGRLVFDGIAVAAADTSTRLEPSRVEIARGERLRITGQSGDAETVFFRALAGLWPWGRGRIVLPGDEAFLHVAHRPYLPPGRLRDVLAYPGDPASFETTDYAAALRSVGLDELVERLDEIARWDEVLGDENQQRLAFARLPLHAPPWIVVDQAFETLDDATRGQVLNMLDTTLKDAAVISIGRTRIGGAFARGAELVEDAEGPRLGAVA